MPRIRTIKPDFWDSPATGQATLRARLLFIAMWNWADDYGVGDATPIRLIGFAFPNDDIAVSDFPLLSEEISERFNVVFYKYEGRPFYYIPSWDKHQRTEKRAKQYIPFPHELENPDIAGVSKKVSDNPLPSDGNADAGNRKGEVGNRKGEVKNTPANAVEVVDRFDVFWNTYAHKVGKGDARRAFKAALKKADAAELIRAAAEHASWHERAATEWKKIPHAATWLNGERWTDERPAPEGQQNKADQRMQANVSVIEQLQQRENVTQFRQIGQ